jgi:hypothetical protein
MRKLKFIFITLLLVCSSLAELYSANRYACATGDWDAIQWYSNNTCTTTAAAPLSTDAVFIQNGANVNLTIDWTTSQTLTVAAGGTLTIQGTLSAGLPPSVSGTLNVTGGLNITGGGATTLVAAGGVINVGTSISFVAATTINGELNVGTAFSGKGVTTGASSRLTVGTNYTVDASSTFNGYVYIGGNASAKPITTGSSSDVTIDGDYTTDGAISIDGYLNVGGAFFGTGITASGTSTLVFLSTVRTNGNVNVTGDMLVTGDYTMNGGTITVNSGGVFSVGGDLDKGGNNVVVNNGGYGIFYGDITSTGGSITKGASGEIVLIGSGTCAVCDKTIDVSPPDPIWAITEGATAIMFEDFTGKAGTTSSNTAYSKWTIPGSSPALVKTAPEMLSVSAGSRTHLNGVVWETDNLSVGCYTDLKISAYFTRTAATISLDYSTNGGTSWTTIAVKDAATNLYVAEFSSITSTIKLRLYTANFNDADATLDNITISGTLGLGPMLPAVELAPGFDVQQVCTGQQVLYRVTEDYDKYTWSVSSSGSNTLSTAATASEALVRWNTLPATLYLTAENSCGRTLSAQWAITSDPSYNLTIVSAVAPLCANDANGSIAVVANCGTAPYTYRLYDADNILKATNATGSFTNLVSGIYSVTSTDAASNEVELTGIDITNPNAISIEPQGNWQTFSCSSTYGCSGYIDFEISGGTGTLTPHLSGTVTADGGTTYEYSESPVVDLEITSLYAQTDYALKVVVEKSVYSSVSDDFSDVRFYAEPTLETPLSFWLDPVSVKTGNEAIFYVKTDINQEPTKSHIYMTYGPDVPDTWSSLSSVLVPGKLSFEYFANQYFGTPDATCYDTHATFNYTTGASFCSPAVTFQKAPAQSFKWKGWVLIPNLSPNAYLKCDVTGDVSLFVAGVPAGSGVKYFDVLSYVNTIQYIEIWFSKPAATDGQIIVGFSKNNGSGVKASEMLIPTDAFTRESMTPEPTILPIFSARYSNLCRGTYRLSVSDENGCTAEWPDDIEIKSESSNIAWGNFPADFSVVRTDPMVGPVANQTIFYESFSETLDATYWKNISASLSLSGYNYKFSGNTTGSIELDISTKNFSGITMAFSAYQSFGGTGGWVPTNDYMNVSYYNGTGWTQILNDQEIWNGTAGVENFNVANDGNTASTAFNYTFPLALEDQDLVRIKIDMASNSVNKNYFLDEMQIIGTIEKSVDPDDSYGYPEVLVDGVVSSDIVPYFTDQVVDDASCGGGIEITRRWNAINDCGNKALPEDRVQLITLFSPDFTPEFDFINGSEPTIEPYSFCVRDITLNIPHVATTTCTPYDIYYEVDGVRSASIFTGTGTSLQATYQPTGLTTTINFPLALGNSVSFSWVLVDPVNVTVTSDYTVTFGDQLTATFTYDPPLSSDICIGDPITISVAAQGGSGSFDSYEFSTSNGTIIQPIGDVITDEYWNDETRFENGHIVKVLITDGECDQEIIAPETMTIHSVISTGVITAP